MSSIITTVSVYDRQGTSLASRKGRYEVRLVRLDRDVWGSARGSSSWYGSKTAARKEAARLRDAYGVGPEHFIDFT